MKLRTFFSSILLALFTGPLIAWSAPPLIASRYGTVSHTKTYQLTLNGKLLENPHNDGDFTPFINRVYQAKSVDVILLSGNIMPNCPQYQLLVLAENSVGFTPVFGTCDIRAQVSQEGDAILVRMKTQLEGQKKLPVTFVFKDGSFGQRETIPFWPQGYIEH